MTWRDALDFEILGGVACKLEDFSGQILEDGGEVDGSFSADARFLTSNVSEVALYATAGKLCCYGALTRTFHDPNVGEVCWVMLGEEPHCAIAYL